MTFSNWPSYSKKELNEVNKIISSGKVNYWTGEQGKRFELNPLVKSTLNGMTVSNQAKSFRAHRAQLKLPGWIAK